MVTLVLLPGMDGTGTLFDPLISILSRTVTVKVVAYPPSESLGYAELERFAEASLPAEGPMVLLGESFSGPIAISLAAKYSARVKGLILCCTFAQNPRPVLSSFGVFVSVMPLGVVPTGIASMALFGRFASPALHAALGRALAAVSASALRARLKAVLEVDATGALARIKAPILCLRATEDRLVLKSASDQITHLQPTALVEVLEGPHCLLQAAPVKAAAVIAAFVRQAENAR